MQMSLKMKIFGLNVITKILIPKGIYNYKETVIVNVLHNMYSFVRQPHNIPKYVHSASSIDTIQDFVCKLCMKPNMHLVEISIFSLNHVFVRPTKIMKDLCEAST